MTKRKTTEEQLDILLKKQEQMKAYERQLKKRLSAENRRKRTKRLIELGAVVESVLGRETQDGEKEKLCRFLKQQEANGRYFSKAMNAPDGTDGKSED